MAKSHVKSKGKKDKSRTASPEEKGFLAGFFTPVNLVSYFFIFGLVVVLPLVYSAKVLDPALHIRLLGLAVILLIFSLFIGVFDVNGKIDFAFLQNRLLWFFAAYFLITAISAFFAYNYKESLLDITKTFSILALVIYVVLVFQRMPSWPEKLSGIVLISALIAVIIGFQQYYDRVINATVEKTPDGDALVYFVKGLMAHKNMYSSSLMLMLPFLAYGTIRQTGFLRIVFVAVTLATLAMILLLSTRSVWLGIILATLASVVVLIVGGNYFNLSKKVRKIALVISLVAVIAGIAIVFTYQGKDGFSVVNRIKSIVDPGASNNPYRLKIWDISFSMAKDYPLTGVGAGNWKIESPKYYKGYGFGKDQLNWVRPHNDFLWVLTEKGIVGFIIFMGIFFMLFWYLIRVWRSELPLDRKVLALLVFGGIIGYMTDSAFSFPLERIDQQVYLGLMSAVVITLHGQIAVKKPLGIRPVVVSVPAMLAFGFIIIYCISEIKMEVMVKEARQYHQKSDWKKLHDLSVKIPTTFRDIDPEVMPVKWYEALALANLDKTEEARDVYLEAVKANPTRINVLNNLGRTYFQLGDYENARKIFEQALAILPNYFESTVNMASTLYQLKDYKKSLEYWERIPKNKRNEPILNNIEMVKRKLQKE